MGQRVEVIDSVHGDIRHLEIFLVKPLSINYVHGDIRHLEIFQKLSILILSVHGDIRHLEKNDCSRI